MNLIFFDGPERNKFLPFTFTRPVADIRTGILTIREKWEHYLNCRSSSITSHFLQNKFPLIVEKENILIKGNLCPNQELINEITNLKVNEGLYDGDIFLAVCLPEEKINSFNFENVSELIVSCKNFSKPYFQLNHVWDIFVFNGDRIKLDFKLLTEGRQSQIISGTNSLLGDDNLVFIEEGATMEYSIINTENGPVYIGKDAEVMEGSKIRGPFALCEHSVLKMDAKIYGPTTIGPYCKVGGEINNSVIFGYSNKAHDGFLGNSVIGEWCNLGADTNNSNLKNNYENVKLWDYTEEKFKDTGIQFCGLFMGDHSKCGINTMFNTGTVVGVSANIFGSGFPRNFIPSFCWGGSGGITVFNLEKAYEVAERVMARRNIKLMEVDKDILKYIFEETIKYRKF